MHKRHGYRLCNMTTRAREKRMSNEAMRYEDERDFHYEKKRGGQLELTLRSRFAVVHVEDGEGTLQLRGSSYGFSAGDVLVITDSAG